MAILGKLPKPPTTHSHGRWSSTSKRPAARARMQPSPQSYPKSFACICNPLGGGQMFLLHVDRADNVRYVAIRGLPIY